MRILVTGSRDWQHEGIVETALEVRLEVAILYGHMPLVVVHGGCPNGADFMAGAWVECMRGFDLAVKAEMHPASWAAFGKGAGFQRNAEMVRAGADICLAFIRNGSNGATHCKNLALQAGIPTRVFLEDAFGKYLGQEYHS